MSAIMMNQFPQIFPSGTPYSVHIEQGRWVKYFFTRDRLELGSWGQPHHFHTVFATTRQANLMNHCHNVKLRQNISIVGF